MAQQHKAPVAAPRHDMPDLPLPYSNAEQYFDDFKNLESKILLDVCNS